MSISDSIWEKVDDDVALKKLPLEVLNEAWNDAKSGPKSPKGPGSAIAGGGAAPSPKKAAGPEVVSALSSRRRQQVAISLARFKGYSSADLIAKIAAYDRTLCTVDNIKLLLTILPTDDEVAAIRALADSIVEGGGQVLDKGDAFCLATANDPSLRARLSAYRFQAGFSRQIATLRIGADLLAGASEQVMASTGLRSLFGLILAAGNYLNANSWRGGAYGARLDSLSALAECRPTAAGAKYASVLHLIADVFEGEHLPTELPALPKVAKEGSLRQLEASFGELRAAATAFAGDLESLQATSSDEVVANLVRFAQHVERKMKEVEEKLTATRATLDRTARYLGENPDAEDFTSTAMFSSLFRLVGLFERSRREVKAPPPSAKGGRGVGPPGGSGVGAGKKKMAPAAQAAPPPVNPFAGAGGAGTLDSMLASLKSGQSQALRRNARGSRATSTDEAPAASPGANPTPLAVPAAGAGGGSPFRRKAPAAGKAKAMPVTPGPTAAMD
jgi:hypothetical protein